MKYQLVLQWPTDLIKSYDKLIEVEDILVGLLCDGSDVDGHDVGFGEMNIFILTNDIESTYGQVKIAIGTHELWRNIRIAYRELKGNTFTVIWPPGLTEFSIC